MAILEQSPLYQEIVSNSEKRGIAIGKQEGITIGKQEGIAIGIQRVALNMLPMGIAMEQVSEATGLSVEQVARLLEKSDLSEGGTP